MLRFVQVLCLAPVFPIVVARIAQTHGGEAIGVYAALALAGPACLSLSAMRAHVPAVPR